MPPEFSQNVKIVTSSRLMIAIAASHELGLVRRGLLDWQRGAAVTGEGEFCYRAGCCLRMTWLQFDTELKAFYRF
jgi:hypothetical protein